MLCVIVVALAVASCASPKFSDNVTIRQTESDYPVAITRNEKGQEFILFYLTYAINKRNMRKIRLSDATYFSEKDRTEKDRTFWFPVSLYSINADSLVYVNDSYNKKRYISYFSQKYVIRGKHYMKNFPKAQLILAPYFEKMKSEHKDTLQIGSIQQLKQINPDLMNELLQGDSIRFDFYYKGRYQDIKLLVEIK